MRSSTLRAAAVVGLALSMLLAASSTASADKPVRTFLPYGMLPPEGITISGICDFPVGLKFILGKEFEKDFSDGRTIITGQVKGTLTNLDTGRSLDINVPVAAHITPHADGSVTIKLKGNVLVWFFTGDLGPGSPAFIGLFSGQEILGIDANGNMSFTQKGGTSEDVCPLLA